MQEHFIVKIPQFKAFDNFYTILASLIIAFLIVYPIMGIGSTISIAAFLLMAVVFYVLLSNMSLENKVDSLPPTAYPVPPHLGLDGISIDSLAAGMQQTTY